MADLELMIVIPKYILSWRVYNGGGGGGGGGGRGGRGLVSRHDQQSKPEKVTAAFYP